jgi:hypothetical protein
MARRWRFMHIARSVQNRDAMNDERRDSNGNRNFAL